MLPRDLVQLLATPEVALVNLGHMPICCHMTATLAVAGLCIHAEAFSYTLLCLQWRPQLLDDSTPHPPPRWGGKMGTSQPDGGTVSIKDLPHLLHICLCYGKFLGSNGKGLLIEPFHFKSVKSLNRACTLLIPG